MRKALGDNPRDHLYIATVAGRGYRIVAQVAESPSRTRPTAEDLKEPRVHRRGHRILWLGVASAVVAVMDAMSFWYTWHSTPEDLAPEPIPLTSGVGFAQDPILSPDGNQIAYDWRPEITANPSIYVKLIGPGTELRLTNPPGADTLPAWSPDGRQIAFYCSLPGHSGYYLVSAIGGPLRQLLQTTVMEGSNWFPDGINWFPDGRHVAIVVPVELSKGPIPKTTFGMGRIVSLDVETGEQKPLTLPPEGNLGDGEPAVSPDGKTLAFARMTTLGTSDIYVQALDKPGAQPRRVTNFGAYYQGIAWDPDSRDLIFEMSQNGRDRLWRLPADGGDAHPITSSIERVSNPTVALQGNRLAYVVDTRHVGLWRVEISGSHPPRAALPQRFIYSARREMQPVYSRDGSKIAFASNRTGPMEIWMAGPDGENAIQLTSLGGIDNGTPRWSPDGSAVAFDSRSTGNPEIFVVSVEGHRVRQITHHPAEDLAPSWSGDGRWIYFASNRNGDFQIYKVPAPAGESPSAQPMQVTIGGGFNAMESADGKYLYFAKGRDRPGLWRRQLGRPDAGSEEPVLDSLQHWGYWALAPNGVFFLERGNKSSSSKVHLKFLEMPSRKITDLRTLEHPVNPWEAPITVSPDGRHVVFEQGENMGSYIVLIDHFR